MSFPISIQSAPERLGIVAAASAWSGGGGSDPVVTTYGPYKGSGSKTFTFTVDDAGIIGTTDTITLDWSDGTESGTLFLGTSADYTAGDVRNLPGGWSISFAAGTFVASASFTVAVTAVMAVRQGHQRVTSEGAAGSDILLRSWTATDSDLVNVTHDGRIRRTTRHRPRGADALLDWADADQLRAFLRLESARHPVTLAENYDEDTRLLFRGGAGLDAMIGRPATFARTGVATYQDPVSGLWRAAATGVPRYGEGIGGRAILVDGGGVTNRLPQFHPKSGAVGWTVSAGSALHVTTSRGVLDPNDDHWGKEYTDGVGVIELPGSGNNARSGTATTVASSTLMTGSVYLRGRGSVTLYLRTGTTTPPTSIKGSLAITLTEEWTRYSVSGTSGGSDNRGDLLIGANEDGVAFEVSAAQLEDGFYATEIIKTDGAAASRNAETITLEPGLPQGGSWTLDFWVRPGGLSSANNHTLASGISAGASWRLYYDPGGTPDLVFKYGGLAYTVTGAATMVARTWHHVAVTMERSGSPSEERVTTYLNGSQVAQTDTNNVTGTGLVGYDDLQLGANLSQTLEVASRARFEDVRVDRVARTATEIATKYERMTEAKWLALHRDFGGRFFDLPEIGRSWMDRVNVDKIPLSLSLVESDRHDASLVTP